MKKSSADQFITLTSTGAILPPDLLARVARRDRELPGLTLKAYRLTPGETINEAISRSWNRLTGVWQNFQDAVTEKNINEDDPAIAFTRDRWLHPLFQELGFGNLEVVHSLDTGEKSYPVSHIYKNTPIHLLGFNVDIDTRSKGVTGAATQSPHSLVQEFLNRSEDHLWGIVSNGYRIRLLRDNVTLTRQAYVEFDLKAMMEGDAYADFALLWLVCHSSRFDAQTPENCWLEKWSKLSAKEGTRALDDLRNGVINAIRDLGTGFLDYPANTELLNKLRDENHPSHLSTQNFYRQILRIVYRLLFLFVAEDRELLLHPDADTDAKKLYKQYYSTRRIRELAESRRGSRHPDIWRVVRLVFNKLGEPEGCKQLGLPALGSFLWSKEAVEDLVDCDISNNSFLNAIRNLCFITKDNVTRRIDYRNLGSEELGSIYESLLELQPEINSRTARFELNSLSGNERKATGSYYTPTSLINELLNSALEPVIDRAVRDRNTIPEDAAFENDPPKARAILNLKICDPATGSGHFLIAAAHRMAKRVAAARTDEEEPSPESYRTALRDVIGHCIYGVDVNPMAVELCKVSLWLEALDPGKPLNFLDHHIKCGNSLLGTTPELIAKGIPTEAFPTKSNLITGDDPKISSSLRKQNNEERKGQLSLDLFSKQEVSRTVEAFGRQIAEIDRTDDSTLETVLERANRYRTLIESESYTHQKLIADAWCAAFMWPKTENMPKPVTQGLFQQLETNPNSIPEETIREINRLANKYQFFNWHIEYPEVFSQNNQGFDVVLGNPPWERVKLQEKEFFAARDEDIANAPNASKRKKLIRELKQNNPALHDAFMEEKRLSEATSLFLRDSGKFPLCGVGDINTYTVFAELNRILISGKGRVGCIVPSGIATDHTTRFFFQDLVEKKALVSLYDFENRKGIFEGVHRSYKFCLLTTTGEAAPKQEAEFAFFALGTEDLKDPEKRFTLSKEDIELINPNTKTCPIFRSARDAELTKYIYRRVPVLINENDKENGNPWGISFMRMFDMSNDSNLFRTREELEEAGWTLEGNIFTKGDRKYLPLYEAKMIHHYNHRFGDYADLPEGSKSTQLPEVPVERLQDPNYEPLPRYWVPEEEVEERLKKAGWEHGWVLTYRWVARSTDARTLIVSVVPRVGFGNSIPVILLNSSYNPLLPQCFAANLSSFVLDYCARQKLGGANMTFSTVNQLPVLSPVQLHRMLPVEKNDTNIPRVLARDLELVYTSDTMKDFAEYCGYYAPPYEWDEERRFQLRCELDALFFHLYLGSEEEWKANGSEELRSFFPTPIDAIEYIMDTFPIMRRKDEHEYSEYRTRNEILSQYSLMRDGLHD